MAAKTNFSTVPLSSVPSRETLKDAAGGRPMVLLVDDDTVVADTLSMILRQFGFATMTAYDAESALQMAAVIPPELLICELSLPHINGFDVAEKITSSTPDCHVVLLTGRAAPVGVTNFSAKRNFECVFLTKPFHPSVLLAEIAEPLKKRSRKFKTHLMAVDEIA